MDSWRVKTIEKGNAEGEIDPTQLQDNKEET